ncbi:MAG: tetratricopeptide repeat-containing serine/threonine-protein kinase [Thermoanaerobaculaceae bacterium]|nr:tetratricopeptide repeat-containing serine/threonine-protein kinase [Thermoanaerobaculaceae bacterium]
MQPGASLGPYEIVAFIGAGGMGEVWRARDTRLEREVALKVLPAASLGDEAARARLVREARVASKLNHPNVCTIHEVGEADGQTYIAMELVEGESLAARLGGRALPAEQVVRYGLQLADALAHAHERGVVHRDFKSGNVVITPEGRAKVLDFGLARQVSDAELAEASTMAQDTLTGPGKLTGTLAYMAPEQLRGQPADARSDIWALGVTLHEMATGTRPFQGTTGFELSSAILSQPPPPLPPTVPPALQAVIERCLDKEPGRRYQRGSEVRAALEAVASGSGVLASSAIRPRAARRRWQVLAVSAVALLVVVAGLEIAGVRGRLLGSGARAEAASLAVLPLENLTGDPEQEYLADGIHDALITDLGKLGSFQRVIARSSVMRFRGTTAPPDEIARQLKVATLVTGAVRREADSVVVTAQLIDPASGAQLWSDTFRRSMRDVLTLQGEVVRAISRAMDVPLSANERRRLGSSRPVNPAAYEAYLRGMYFVNKSTRADAEKGLTFLREAVEKDPADPLANAGLALGYIEIAHGAEAREDSLLRGRAAARTALSLDGTLAEALAACGMAEGYFDWKWNDGLRSLDRALEVNPNLAIAYYHRSWYHALFGRMKEAIEDHKRAQELDPLNPLHTAWLGELYRWEGRLDEAEAEARRAIEMDPRFPPSYFVLGLVYQDRGMYDQAIAAMQKAEEASPPWHWAVGPTYVRAGRAEEARRLLAELNTKKPTPWGAFWRVAISSALGEHDEAFRWLEYEPHHIWIAWFRVLDWCPVPRTDPRFDAALRRMNLPPLPLDPRKPSH